MSLFNSFDIDSGDTDYVNFFYTCAVSNERSISEKFLSPRNYLFRVAKQILNITEAKLSHTAYDFAEFYNLIDWDCETRMYEKNVSRFEILPYGMMVEIHQFGTVISPIFYKINSLLKPFDIPTWLLLIESICSLCLYF